MKDLTSVPSEPCADALAVRPLRREKVRSLLSGLCSWFTSVRPSRCRSLLSAKACAIGAVLSLPTLAFAAFGVTTSGTNHIVDTGAGLVFTVNGSGDIRSIVFGGKELLDLGKPTGIASGTGATSVTATTTGNTIKLTCTASVLTQYYVVRQGENNIYMATFTTAEPPVGELRFIGRFNQSVINKGNPAADLTGNVGTVEGSDVFKLANGQTRSKFYSAVRFIDDHVHGATGSGVGVFMVISSSGYEATSGGPFFRDIDNQAGGDQEIYFYMNSGHSKTEPDRMGLHGPYALCFTSGAAPSATLDMSFMGSLGIQGWVTNRGHVTGTYSGIPAGTQAVIGWANPTAQYWTYATGGTFTSPPMIPGTYTMTLYKNELDVGSTSVTVGTGTTTKNIASTEANPSTIWQIGTFDGTPAGFMNASLQTFMHPSDVRMRAWTPTTYAVGSPISDFPMAEFQLVNDPLKISFNLTQSQVVSHRLRIGTTVSFGAGRPQITVNPGTSHQFVGPAPAAPVEPLGRSITRGVYHGFYALYNIDIPASAFVAGTNIIQINILGKGPFGTFLSASLVYDAIALDGVSSGGPVPVTGVTVTPATASILSGASTTLSATVAPANATNSTITWSSSDTSVATVNASGVVTGFASGSAIITARTQDGGFTDTATISVTNANIPVTGVTVTPATATVAVGSTTSLTALVAPANASNKTVAWSSSASGIASVSSAGVVTGVAAGTATITATAQGGFSDTSVVTVTGGGGGTPCTGPTPITLPFAKDGVGDSCFVTSGTISFINSWNMQLVEVNGVAFTNLWANSLPARINGNYYIHYVGSFPWSHLEINGSP